MLQLCVPMVLQTLQMLASAPKLRAVAMRLMTVLWKKQVCDNKSGPYNYHINIRRPSLFCRVLLLITDSVPPSRKDRIYPELQRLLGQQDSRVVVGRDAQWEQVLARAACLRDICRERSDHHTHTHRM